MQGPEMIVRNADGPREALFLHLIETYGANDQFGSRPICLLQLEPARVARIAERMDNVHREDGCEWEQGGVIFRSSGEPAMLMHAAVECSGRACSAEGGVTYGNLGAEGHGYRMRRTAEGWAIRKTGIMWIS